jgi:hypothetical protein
MNDLTTARFEAWLHRAAKRRALIAVVILAICALVAFVAALLGK